MTRRCDSSPAQYERNRRFGHLVHVLGRSAGGAKLPSVGLCLNASKAESRLVTATIPSGLLFAWGRIGSVFHPSPGNSVAGSKCPRLSRSLTLQSGGPKSSVDDLCTGRGVVLGRAATTLRSIETQPFRLDDLSCQLDKSSTGSRRGCFLFCFSFLPSLSLIGESVGSVVCDDWPGRLPFFYFTVSRGRPECWQRETENNDKFKMTSLKEKKKKKVSNLT